MTSLYIPRQFGRGFVGIHFEIQNVNRVYHDFMKEFVQTSKGNQMSQLHTQPRGIKKHCFIECRIMGKVLKMYSEVRASFDKKLYVYI
jgi:hypothetical protein